MSTLSDILSTITAALRPLVGNRVYARTFEQPSGGLPSWPSIRLTVLAADTNPDACDDGGDEGSDFAIQIDVVSDAALGESASLTLRAQVLAAMLALGAEYVYTTGFSDFDVETKTNRDVLEYGVYLSSEGPTFSVDSFLATEGSELILTESSDYMVD